MALRVVTAAPASLSLYGIVVGTSIVQSLLSSEAAHRATVRVSTNLANLLALRWPVLVASAFWLEGPDFVTQLAIWFVLFACVFVPAERWLGTRRWLLAFFIAHIGATIVTAFRLWIAVKLGHQPASARHAVDVGLSYGFLGVLALQCYRLRPPWRWVAAGALLVPLAAVLRVDRQFTDAGHLVAVIIGLALYPLIPTTGHEGACVVPPIAED